MTCHRAPSLGLAAALALGAGGACAQATVKQDGQWRAAVAVGFSSASGNNDARSLTVTADAVRATAVRKTSLYANGLYASADGKTRSNQLRFGGRHDRELWPRWFGFGGVDFETNRIANLDWRTQLVGGLGHHAVKTDRTTWDLFGGLTYTDDRFGAATLIDGKVRSRYSYASLYLAEESTHKLTETTTARQRLAVYPNLSESGEYRATLDCGIAVAMTRLLNLTLGVGVRHNSKPGAGFKTTDTVVTAGVGIKFE